MGGVLARVGRKNLPYLGLGFPSHMPMYVPWLLVLAVRLAQRHGVEGSRGPKICFSA